MLISSTPPSKPLSRVQLFWKVTRAPTPVGTLMSGDSRVLVETAAELPVAAPLGAETKNPAVALVAQPGGGVVPVTEAVHPAGRAGAVTPSKFSLKLATKLPRPRLKVTLPRSLGP